MEAECGGWEMETERSLGLASCVHKIQVQCKSLSQMMERDLDGTWHQSLASACTYTCTHVYKHVYMHKLIDRTSEPPKEKCKWHPGSHIGHCVAICI